MSGFIEVLESGHKKPTKHLVNISHISEIKDNIIFIDTMDSVVYTERNECKAVKVNSSRLDLLPYDFIDLTGVSSDDIVSIVKSY